MEVNKAENEVINKAIDTWISSGKLTAEKGKELKSDIVLRRSERQLIAQYFFIIALSCTLLAFGAIFIDDKLLEKIKHYFAISDLVIALLTGGICVVWFWYVQHIKQKLSVLSYEIYMVLGALAALTSMVYICKDINTQATYTLLFAFASLLLFVLSTFFRSASLWICAVIALLGWFGNFSTDHSISNLFLGMNYAVRYAMLGLVLLSLSYLQKKISPLIFTARITFVSGLLVFFIGMWMVSIFGNFGSFDEWLKIRQTRVIPYSIVFAVSGVLSFFLGLRYKDEMARDLGALFLMINLYTRYFEFFWDSMNKGLFFLILAVTFGLLGRWLERKKHALKVKPEN